MYKPDYQTLRHQAGFSWSVSCGQSFLIEASGLSFQDFYLKPEACIEGYRKGRQLLTDWFDKDVPPLIPHTPGIRYGHVNCLGAELRFPEQGEVGTVHPCGSLPEAMAMLESPRDYRRLGMMPFYLDFWETMKKAFAGGPVGFGFGNEGPVTTAWELRGEGFFMDLYDQPARVKDYLAKVTASVLDFRAFICSLYDCPPINPDAGYLADDVAAMIPPSLWPQLVVPYWDVYYAGTTTGKRMVHVEDLKPDHLRFLEELGIHHHDPCMSPKLNPKILCTRNRVPFEWCLLSFHFDRLASDDVRHFVFRAAAEGASQVSVGLEWGMAKPETLEKVKAFIAAGKLVSELLEKGANRSDLEKMMPNSIHDGPQ